ncbi:MAG: hypothetical protein LBM67_07490 [Lentimicrobiaceae bacterium]|jgi:hypothetical protein|nr:hypothetical protein [Lentimicrobiaceae bacterium]
MKSKIFFCVVFVAVFCMQLHAQHNITYQSYYSGSQSGDTSKTTIISYHNQYMISSFEKLSENPITGLAETITYVDNDTKQIITQLVYSENEHYYSKSDFNTFNTFEKSDETATILGFKCKKVTTSINSNTIEIWYSEEAKISANPSPHMGFIPGMVLKTIRNGSAVTEAVNIKKEKKIKDHFFPQNMGIEKTARELNNLKKEKLIITIPIFENDQIHWGDTSRVTHIPHDTTLHFAGGTLILKRINISALPDHYQLFAEIKTHSNGDAYDRTGSVFVIPESTARSFTNGLINGMDDLPILTGKDGEKYQGIRLEKDFLPVIELVRFFTPFGVRHFNDRVQIDGLDWSEEAYYKQEISDLRNHLQGDVLIGAYIGNYDKGGHLFNLNLLAYPGSYAMENSNKNKTWDLSLFNTCTIMEMGGQNYGKLFGTDSLTIEFEIPENVQHVKLRYISTGHGGWGGGDEFNQKENSIFIDGEKRFVYTPWREDCATFRELNPVSGNFWNGISSSDYSRSGWCPGTATQPVYFNLYDLKPGKHTMTIAIPQGDPEGGNFSHWNISGILIGELIGF